MGFSLFLLFKSPSLSKIPTEMPAHDAENLLKYSLMAGVGQRVGDKIKLHLPRAGNSGSLVLGPRIFMVASPSTHI